MNSIKDIKLHETAAYKSKRGSESPASLQFSIPTIHPPPGDRQRFQLGQRDLLAAFEARLTWTPPAGYAGPTPERLALETIGQGISITIQDELSNEQVKTIVDAWYAWAKKG